MSCLDIEAFPNYKLFKTTVGVWSTSVELVRTECKELRAYYSMGNDEIDCSIKSSKAQGGYGEKTKGSNGIS